MPLNKNNQILAFDEENFQKLHNIEVPPQWKLLTEQNLFNTKLSSSNSLDKLFLDIFPPCNF